MSDRTYTVTLRNNGVQVTNKQLSEFADMCKLPSDISSRVSELFWLDLYIYNQNFGVDPDVVLRELHNLESGNDNSQTKPAAQFQRKPLLNLPPATCLPSARVRSRVLPNRPVC